MVTTFWSGLQAPRGRGAKGSTFCRRQGAGTGRGRNRVARAQLYKRTKDKPFQTSRGPRKGVNLCSAASIRLKRVTRGKTRPLCLARCEYHTGTSGTMCIRGGVRWWTEQALAQPRAAHGSDCVRAAGGSHTKCTPAGLPWRCIARANQSRVPAQANRVPAVAVGNWRAARAAVLTVVDRGLGLGQRIAGAVFSPRGAHRVARALPGASLCAPRRCRRGSDHASPGNPCRRRRRPGSMHPPAARCHACKPTAHTFDELTAADRAHSWTPGCTWTPQAASKHSPRPPPTSHTFPRTFGCIPPSRWPSQVNQGFNEPDRRRRGPADGGCGPLSGRGRKLNQSSLLWTA